VTRDSIRNLVRGPAIHPRRTRIARLVGSIVRNLGLIKISPPAVAVPQNLEFLVMLYKQAIDRDIISVHYQPVVAGIQIPANSVAMVRSPDFRYGPPVCRYC